MTIRDVVIVGGGAVGLCCAIALAQRGAKVTLVERGLPGAATSTLNGGGIRQQFGTATNIALALLSAPWWDTFEDRFGVDPRFRRIGYLFLGRGLAETAALQANVAAQNGSGIDSEYLDEDEIARRWPALDRCSFTGAAFRQADGWANQHRIIDGLVRGALAAGVDVQVGTEVLVIESRSGQVTGLKTTAGPIAADAVVLATGPWILPLLRPFGLVVPVDGRRHDLLIVEPAEPLPTGLPWLIDIGAQIHLRSDAPGRALVGGFLGHDDIGDPDEYAPRADRRWAADVLDACGRNLGVVDGRARIAQGWAGLYPGTPDRHPIVDQLAEGLYAALGFAGTGLMHAPAAGLLIAELIVDGLMLSADAVPLSMQRFAGGGGGRVETTGF